jgi:hypothetical protein
MENLYRLMYTYQTFGKHIVKEQSFENRVSCLKQTPPDEAGYRDELNSKIKKQETLQIEIKDIVFDYFNIITKEYEMSYEKWRKSDAY